MSDIGSTYFPQIFCLLAQTFLTILTTIKLLQNRDQFPIKQLGPISTLAAIYCFELANIINLIGRIIQQSNNLYDPLKANHPQCRTHNLLSLYFLGLLFNLVRQLPFVIFTLKTLRVSICFWRPFNKIDVERIFRWVITIFKNQAYIIYVSVCYACFFVLLLFIYNNQESQYNHFYYQYFCPRKGNILQIIISSLRVLMLIFVYMLSIWTYKELDFKKFIFMIFITSNLTYILRIYMQIVEKQSQYSLFETTYHEFYYLSMVVSLLQTIVATYFTSRKQQLNPPPMQGVLQAWDAFHNLKIGITILEDYAIERDQLTEIKYHYRCLESYNFLDSLLKYSRTSPQNFNLKNFLQPIERILELNDLVKHKLGPIAISLKRKCKDGTILLSDVTKIEKVLSEFCQTVIFQEWRKTKSYRALKQEFIANGDINQKLELFDIPLN